MCFSHFFLFRHYVPLAPDLSNLLEVLQQLESNETWAQTLAAAGTLWDNTGSGPYGDWKRLEFFMTFHMGLSENVGYIPNEIAI